MTRPNYKARLEAEEIFKSLSAEDIALYKTNFDRLYKEGIKIKRERYMHMKFNVHTYALTQTHMYIAFNHEEKTDLIQYAFLKTLR